MSNFPGGMLRQLPPDNNWALALPMPPDTPIPCIDIAKDTGKFIKGILTHRDSMLGKRVLASVAYYTPTEIVAIFAELYPEAGKKAKFAELSKETYKDMLAKDGMPEKAQEELYQNMGFMYEFGYYGKEGLDESQAVRPYPLSALICAHTDLHVVDPRWEAINAERFFLHGQTIRRASLMLTEMVLVYVIDYTRHP